MITLQHYLVLSVALFIIGAVGAVVRRNILIIFMSVELMLASAGIVFLAFSRWNLLPEGHVLTLFVLSILAAQTLVGLSIVFVIFRFHKTVFVDEMKLLKE